MPVQNFCHQCHQNVRLRDTDLICATCGGDFIEQIEVPFIAPNESMDSDGGSDDRTERDTTLAAILARQAEIRTQRVPNPFGIANVFNFLNRSQEQQRPPQPPAAQSWPPRHQHLHHHGPLGRVEIHVEGNDQVGPDGGVQPNIVSALQGILQRVGGQHVNLQIHVGPDENLGGATVQVGDYVIGNNMEQLLNELMQQFGDGQAQQGISEENLKYLPIVKVQQEHVDNKTQCSTCFEDYVIGEEVAQLKCNHIFHPECVKPWLATHNTCPVCRNVVDPKDWGIPAGSEGTSPPAAAPQTQPSTSSNTDLPGFVEDELD